MFHPIKKNLPRTPNIKLNNYKLKLKSHVKYLGITIDEVLSWNKHIENLIKRLARANGVLSKLHHFIPREGLFQYTILFFKTIYYIVPELAHLIFSIFQKQ